MKRPIPVYLFLLGVLFFVHATRKPELYGIGDKAENFRLRNVDGRMISLSDFPNAKGYIVIFTCNHCPYAQLYEQRIINLHKKYEPKGFPVIAINPNDAEILPDDSFEEMVKRSKEKRFPFVYLHDSSQVVYPKFGANRTPHVFVLNKDTVVSYIGAIDDNPENPAAVRKRYVENAVDALLHGEQPEPKFTRAIGCTIKRKRN